MKIMLLYIHLLSLATAVGSMFIAEHLILSRGRPFTHDRYDTVLFASHTVSVSLLLLWLTGIGFLALGYMNDPAYILNQKIWAKVSIVFLMSINGIYIHRRLLPRLATVARGESFARSTAESVRFRLSFAISLAGWLIAAFYGAAKFLNQGYYYEELLGVYLAAVIMILACSYLVSDQLLNEHPPGATMAEPG
jgi:uncharacterized membrane protein